MNEMKERVADKLIQRFKARVAFHAGIPFEETSVALPNREIWLDYASAAIEEMRNPTVLMENAGAELDDWGVASDPGPGHASALSHWHAMIEQALK